MVKILLLVALLVCNLQAFAAEPEPVDFICSQGEDCAKILVLADPTERALNLNGYSYLAQVRINPTDTAPLAEIAVDQSELSLGRVGLLIPASLTTQLAGKVGYWDLRQTDPSGMISYPLRGRFKCYPSITR